MGIYPIFSVEDWQAACDDIREHSNTWSEQYGATVVNNTNFLVESYLDGEEYAIDAYFNEQGETIILDILKHDFAGTEDVSDRLYYTSKVVVEDTMQAMKDFLIKSNELLDFKNFPVHVEVRVDEAGVVTPIEFNPMRLRDCAPQICLTLHMASKPMKCIYVTNSQIGMMYWPTRPASVIAWLCFPLMVRRFPIHIHLITKQFSESFPKVLACRQLNAKAIQHVWCVVH